VKYSRRGCCCGCAAHCKPHSHLKLLNYRHVFMHVFMLGKHYAQQVIYILHHATVQSNRASLC